MDRRFLLTALVCCSIYFAWIAFFAPPPKRAHPASQPAVTRVNNNADVQSPAAGAATAALPGATATSLPVVEEKSIEVQTPDYTATLSTLGASITSFTLGAYKEAQDPKAVKRPVNLVQGEHTRAVSLELNDQPFPFATVEKTDGAVLFTGDAGGLKAQARWRIKKDYALALEVHFENTTAAPIQIAPRIAVRGLFNERALKDKSFLAPPPDVLTALISIDGSLAKHTIGKKDLPDAMAAPQWVGVDRQYFLIAAAPAQASAADFLETRASSDYVELGAAAKNTGQTIEPGKSADLQYAVFVGPKVAKLLREPGVGFDDAINYKVLGMPLGFLSRPMLWILNQAQRVVGNYGWAIAILTLIVKILLFPVTQKSFVSMQIMKDMKPDLDKIKERFPNDREKQGAETMRLYKERGVNPFLSGCLPALLQMPVYFALWRTLWAAVELYQQEFLWFKDLTQPDPYYIVPALLGVTMFIQQKISPPAGDPQQQKIMLYMMPPLMTSFMLFLPAGLVFYIFINTILTILQQTYISKKFSKKPIPAAA